MPRAAVVALVGSAGVLPISYFVGRPTSAALIRLPASGAEGQIAG
jgi:hypothetical protein